jgi:hypothetical protein
MATVKVFTSARMKEIEGQTVVGGQVVGGVLNLVRHNGQSFYAGVVRGPEGIPGQSMDGINVLDHGILPDILTPQTTLLQTLVDNVSAEGGGVIYMPDGVYYNDRPLLGRSNIHLRLHPNAEWINTHPTLVATAQCFWAGNYHPFYTHSSPQAVPKSVYDTLAPLDAYAHSVELTSATLTYTPGDLVMIYGPGPEQVDIYSWLAKIASVDGTTITLDRPVPVDRAGVGFITKGGTGFQNINPETESPYPVYAYYIENFHVSGGRWTSVGPVTARAACLRGSVRDIKVTQAHTLLMGNAWTECLFENISGRYVTRVMEVTDGARDNVWRNIQGRATGTNLEDDSVMKIGRGDTLDGFRVHESSQQPRDILGVFEERQTIKNGEIVFSNAVNQALHVRPQGKDAVLENIRVRGKSSVLNAVRVSGPNARLRDITVDIDGLSTPALRIITDTTGLDIDGFRGNGELSISNDLISATMRNLDVTSLNFSNLPAQLGRVRGHSNRVRNQDELMNLIRSYLYAHAVTATTETEVLGTVFTQDQVMYIGDRITFSGLIEKVGTTNPHNIKLIFGDETVFDLAIPQAETGLWRIEGSIESPVSTGLVFLFDTIITDPSGVSSRVVSRNTNARVLADKIVSLRAWRDSGTMTIRSWRFGSRRFLEST